MNRFLNCQGWVSGSHMFVCHPLITHFFAPNACLFPSFSSFPSRLFSCVTNQEMRISSLQSLNEIHHQHAHACLSTAAASKPLQNGFQKPAAASNWPGLTTIATAAIPRRRHCSCRPWWCLAGAAARAAALPPRIVILPRARRRHLWQSPHGASCCCFGATAADGGPLAPLPFGRAADADCCYCRWRRRCPLFALPPCSRPGGGSSSSSSFPLLLLLGQHQVCQLALQLLQRGRPGRGDGRRAAAGWEVWQ